VTIRFLLPLRQNIHPNNERDPLAFYYRRTTGWLYRHRLQMGLDLLPSDRSSRILEIGVGSGILVPTLTAHFRHYTVLDLVLADGLQSLVAPECQASLATLDLLDTAAFSGAPFDTVVCFSVLEHIRDSHAAALALQRLLAPCGTLVVGYPMVNPLMTATFAAIGYRRIGDDHVATPAVIDGALRSVLTQVGRRAFPPGARLATALYQCTAWRHPGAEQQWLPADRNRAINTAGATELSPAPPAFEYPPSARTLWPTSSRPDQGRSTGPAAAAPVG